MLLSMTHIRTMVGLEHWHNPAYVCKAFTVIDNTLKSYISRYKNKLFTSANTEKISDNISYHNVASLDI